MAAKFASGHVARALGLACRHRPCCLGPSDIGVRGPWWRCSGELARARHTPLLGDLIRARLAPPLGAARPACRRRPRCLGPSTPVFEDRGATRESSSGHNPRPCSGTSSGRDLCRRSGEPVRPRPALLGGAHPGLTHAAARGSLSGPRCSRPWGRSGRERRALGEKQIEE